MGMPVPPGLGMPHSTPMMAAGNPYGPSGPPPAALSGSIPPGGPMYPGPATMHPQSMPPKVPSNLNTIQLQQLSAQIKAYKLLSRNVPPPEALLSIVSGRRPTPAMLTAGKFNRPQMSPQQRAMMVGHPPSHLSSGGQSVPSPKSSVGQTPPSGGAEIPGGQPANISLYPPSPSRSQSGSPKPQIQSQSQSQLTQSHSNIPQPVPNVTISASGELPLPVRQALSAAQLSAQGQPATPATKDSTPTADGGATVPSATVKVEQTVKGSTQPQQLHQKAQLFKQVKVAPTGIPQGIDPVMILKEREARCVVIVDYPMFVHFCV